MTDTKETTVSITDDEIEMNIHCGNRWNTHHRQIVFSKELTAHNQQVSEEIQINFKHDM